MEIASHRGKTRLFSETGSVGIIFLMLVISPECTMEHRFLPDTIEEGKSDHCRNLNHANLNRIG